MKDLKDYLHLYIGCDVQYPDTDGKLKIATLTGVSRADGVETTYKKKRFKKGETVGDYLSWKPNGYHDCNATNLQLILRPLSEMTKAEAKEIICIDECEIIEVKNGGIIYSTEESETEREYLFFSRIDASRFKFLLSRGFDLFGLIEAGLAITKK